MASEYSSFLWLSFSVLGQLNPAYTEAHLNLGRALMNSGHRDEALDEFRTVLTQAPGNSEARARILALNAPK